MNFFFIFVALMSFSIGSTSCSSSPPSRSQEAINQEKKEVEARISRERERLLMKKEIEAQILRELKDRPKKKE